MVEVILFGLFVGVVAFVSYLRGWAVGLRDGHDKGLENGQLIGLLTSEIMEADRGLREDIDIDSVSEEEYRTMLFERVDRIRLEKHRQGDNID